MSTEVYSNTLNPNSNIPNDNLDDFFTNEKHRIIASLVDALSPTSHLSSEEYEKLNCEVANLQTILERNLQVTIKEVETIKDTLNNTLSKVILDKFEEDLNESVVEARSIKEEFSNATANSDDQKVEVVKDKTNLVLSRSDALQKKQLPQFKDLNLRIEALRLEGEGELFEYSTSLAITMTAAYDAAKLVMNGTFKPDLSNIVSKLATLGTLLPFGGTFVATVVQGASEAYVHAAMVKPMKKLCSSFHPSTFGTMVGELSLSVTYAAREEVEKLKPKIYTRFEKFKKSVMQLLKGDYDDSFFDTPYKVAGHYVGIVILKAIYEDTVSIKPYADFPSRLEEWSVKNCVGVNSDKVENEVGSILEAALSGCTKVVGEFG